MSTLRFSFDAFLDGFSGAGLFGKVSWPGAPTALFELEEEGPAEERLPSVMPDLRAVAASETSLNETSPAPTDEEWGQLVLERDRFVAAYDSFCAAASCERVFDPSSTSRALAIPLINWADSEKHRYRDDPKPRALFQLCNVDFTRGSHVRLRHYVPDKSDCTEVFEVESEPFPRGDHDSVHASGPGVSMSQFDVLRRNLLDRMTHLRLEAERLENELRAIDVQKKMAQLFVIPGHPSSLSKSELSSENMSNYGPEKRWQRVL